MLNLVQTVAIIVVVPVLLVVLVVVLVIELRCWGSGGGGGQPILTCLKRALQLIPERTLYSACYGWPQPVTCHI